MHDPHLPVRSTEPAPDGAVRRRAGVALTAAALVLSGLAASPAAAADAADAALTEAEQLASGHAAARAAAAAATVSKARAAARPAVAADAPLTTAAAARTTKTTKAAKAAKTPKTRTPKPTPPPTTPPTTAPTTPPAAPATGTVRYVDPAGDDTADGRSPETALRTLDAVSALDLEPGDEVRLKAGAAFAGTLLLTAEDAGTAAAPVRIAGWQGRATIEAGTGPGVVVHDAGGVQVSGLTVVGSGQVGTSARDAGVLFFTALDGGVRLPAVGVSDVDVSGFGGAGVEVGAWNASWSGFSRVDITGVTAHGNGDAGISTFGYFAPRSRQYSLTDVTVERSVAHGNLGIAGKGLDSGSGIQLGGVLRGAVRSSEAYGNGANNDAPDGPAGVMVWESAEVTVSDNDSHDNRSTTRGGSGFAFAGGVQRSALTRNTSSGNDGPGFLVHQPAGFRPTEGNTVNRNVSTGDGVRGGAGLELSGPPAGTGVKDTDVYLNTVVADGAARTAVRVTDPVDTAEVHDNVLVARGGAALVDAVGGSDLLRFERNTWISGVGGFLVLWDGVRYTSLADWRAATGQEPTGV